MTIGAGAVTNFIHMETMYHNLDLTNMPEVPRSSIYTCFLPQGGEIEIIFVLWAVASEIQAASFSKFATFGHEHGQSSRIINLIMFVPTNAICVSMTEYVWKLYMLCMHHNFAFISVILCTAITKYHRNLSSG